MKKLLTNTKDGNFYSFEIKTMILLQKAFFVHSINFQFNKKMGHYVDRIFVEKLIQCYHNRRKNHWPGCSCYHCKRYYKLIKEKKKWSFDGLNCYHNRWFFIFTKQSNLTLFPVFI